MRPEPKPLSTQVLVITGATSGIGLSTARMAAARGAAVVLVSRNEAALAGLVAEIEALGGRAAYAVADVGDEAEVKAAARKADEAFGGFDTWINNAGVSIYGAIEDTPIEDQRRLFDTNYWGIVYGTLTALDHLRAREGGGTIINIGSVLSDQAIPLQGVYSASKHAVKGFTNALRSEMKRSAPDVRLTLIKPSAIDTPYKEHARNYTDQPATNPPPVYSTPLVAEAILHAAETPVREITVGFGGRALALFSQLAPGAAETAMPWAMPLLTRDRQSDQPRDTDALYKPGRDQREHSPYRFVLKSSLYTRAQMNPRVTAGVVLGAAVAGLLGLKLRDGLRLHRIKRQAGLRALRTGARLSTEGEKPSEAPAGAFERDHPLAEAFRCAHLPMMIGDAQAPGYPVLFANDAFLSLSGYTEAEVVGRNCRFLQGPDTDPRTVQEIRDGLAAGRDVTVDILNYRKDGRPFWNGLHISPIRIKDKPVRHFFASQTDITAQKEGELGLRDAAAGLERAVETRTQDLREALDQKTVLLHEVDHRVKNNLQLISALMLLQARRSEEPPVRLALERMLERLNAISTVHRRLFQSDDAASFDVADFLRDLAADLHGATGRDDIALDLALEPVSVPANQAASLALMVNEVVSNALRHAFPEGRGGKVAIRLNHRENGFCICVEDDGVGRSERPAGFGTTIVELLGRQLKADINYDNDPPGAAVRIDLPLSA